MDASLTTTQEQEESACVIKTFLDTNHEFVEKHLYSQYSYLCKFFTWHRHFIGEVEEHLTSMVWLNTFCPLRSYEIHT